MDIPQRLKPKRKNTSEEKTDDLSKRLNERMNIYNPNKKIESRNKREWRRSVLHQCIKQDMFSKEPLNSYPYETKMYPAIKYIADIAPPEWDWDRLTVRDIIRTICLDRVPTIN
jgi:hypothetical protein